MKADKETEKVISDAEHLRMMTESEGWKIAYQSLTDRILDLQNINNVDDSSIENAIADMKARKAAATILFEWVKRDVYGKVEQSTVAQAALENHAQETFIERS